MTVEEARLVFLNMRSHYDSGFSSEEERVIESIYIRLFNRPMPKRSGCSDCYRDAYVEILNKLNTIKDMPKESPYRLKAGVVASSFGSSDFYVLDMPEEAAEKWLHEYPQRINQFQKFPDDWKERVDARFAESETDEGKMEETGTQGIDELSDGELTDDDGKNSGKGKKNGK